MSKTKYAIYRHKETLLESWCKDIVSLLVLAFLIWFSIWGNSVFWTFITGGMGLLYMIGKVSKALGQSKDFSTKKDLQKWVDSLPDED